MIKFVEMYMVFNGSGGFMLELLSKVFSGEVFALCVFPNKSGLIEIISNKELRKGIYGMDFIVIGTAGCEFSAAQMVRQFIADFVDRFDTYEDIDFTQFKPWLAEGRK